MSSVVALSPVETGQSNLTIVTATQRIVRQWMPHITPAEFTVLIQIVDRTIGWQKTRASFSLERVLSGDKVYGGINMSRRNLFYALSSLEKKGMIARHPHPEGKQIRVYSVNMGWTPAMLNLPKRLKTGANIAPDQCNDCTGPVQILHTRESNPGEGNPENEDYAEPAAPRTINPQDLVREAMEGRRATLSAARTSRAPKTLNQTVDAAQGEWRAAIAETHPTGAVLSWNPRQVAMVKNKAKGWMHSRRITFPKFLGWCAANWSAVCRVQLKWMTKSPPPATPKIEFLISFIDNFVEAWSSGDLDNWMNEAQRTEYERLIAKGRTHDEALHEMAKSDAVEVMRDENKQARTEAARNLSIAAAKEKRAERMMTMPVHPRSPAAEAARRAAIAPPARKRVLTDDELAKHDFTAVPLLDKNWEPPLD